MKISEREKLCLEILLDHYNGWEGNCVFFWHIAKEIKLEKRQVRIAVRSLARKGLAKYTRGLMDDEGFAAGSGYCATELGRKLGDELEI